MKKVLKIIGLVILLILYFGYLEIFKNQLWGYLVAVIAIILFTSFNYRCLRNRKLTTRFLSCTAFVAVLAFVAFLSHPVQQQICAVKCNSLIYTDEISVSQGKLVGVYNEDQSVEVFTGIPYAKPPVGDLRWREPQEPDSWDGVKKCDYFAPMAMQKRSNPIVSFGTRIIGYNDIPLSLKDNFLEAMSEDCLYLNIWRPAGTKASDHLPVLFFIHGGSLNSGQTYWDAYNGENLTKHGIIVVNIAYRVGVFGYMADKELSEESPNHTTGNYGLLDQIQALKWVNENIGYFGGNARNITIAGESAGSSSVNALCVSPLTKGLFRRVIAESSSITPKTPYHTFRTYSDALKTGPAIKKEFACSTIDELRKIPAEELVQTSVQNNEMTVDGYALTQQPYLSYEKGLNHEEAVLGGFNGDEATVFLMFNNKANHQNYEEKLRAIAGEYAHELATIWPALNDSDAAKKYNDLVGAAWFGYGHYTWSEYTRQQGIPTYLYFFQKNNSALGAWHAGELPYFFGNIPGYHGFKNRYCITLPNTYNQTDYDLSWAMQTYYTNFVKTGNPNLNGPEKNSGLPYWKTYNENPEQYLLFGDEIKMKDNKYRKAFYIFDKKMER